MFYDDADEGRKPKHVGLLINLFYTTNVAGAVTVLDFFPSSKHLESIGEVVSETSTLFLHTVYKYETACLRMGTEVLHACAFEKLLTE